MLEGAALLSFYLAFALLHAARPRRVPFERWRPAPAWHPAMRFSAVLAVVAGVLLLSRAETITGVFLVALTAIAVNATVFVLLAPIFPRVFWGLAALCPPLVLVLSLLGIAYG